MKLVDYLKELNEGKKLSVTTNLGYVIVPNCIRRCLRLSQEEKLLLFEIYCLYNEEKGYAFPTQQTLAMNMGVTSSTISKVLKKLEDKKFIMAYGKKGKRKRYVPSLNLHNNGYIVISETFHFGTKIINKHLPDDIGGEWGNKLLQFVNVQKNLEYTDQDPYGRFLLNFQDNTSVTDELLILLTTHVENITNVNLDINWNEEIKEYKKIKKDKKENKPYKSFNNRRRNYEPEVDEDWLRQLGDD